MSEDLAPFTCTFTPGLPALLSKLNCTIAITTYQAGKLIFISAKDDEQLIQLPRTFKKPMGIGISENRLALATQDEVVILSNTPGASAHYPKSPQTYDAIYMPRSVYYTGELDIHDLHWIPQGLLAVNTRFSCLALIDDRYSFTPVWKPAFIKSLQPTDNCHLNGIALLHHKPKYITALGSSDVEGGWRATKASGGILMDAESQEIILHNLAMPHSPRLYGNQLFLLLSATGEIAVVDPLKKKYDVVQKFNGFARGMDRLGDYLFIGLSKLRTSSRAFGDLPIASKSVFCGVVVMHLPTGKIEGHIKYENSVEEIYDVKILNNIRRPGILNHYKDEQKMLVTMPQGSYWATPPKAEEA